MPIEPWGAYPPEVNSSRIIGTGLPSWSAMSSSWASMAGIVAQEIIALGGTSAGLGANWVGSSGGTTVAKLQPYVAWLMDMERIALENAAATGIVALTYTTTLASVVPLPLVNSNRLASVAAATEAAVAQAVAAVPGIGLAAVPAMAQAQATVAELEAQYAGMWTTNATSMTSYDTAVTAASTPKFPTPPPHVGLTAGDVTGDIATMAKLVENAGGQQSADILRQVTNPQQLQQLSQMGPTGTGQMGQMGQMGQAMNPYTSQYGAQPRSLSDSEFRSMLSQLGSGGGGLRSFGGMSSSGTIGSSGGLGAGLQGTGTSSGSLGALSGMTAAAPTAVFGGIPMTPPPPSMGAPMGGAPMVPPMGGARGAAQGSKSSSQFREIVDENPSILDMIPVISMQPRNDVSDTVADQTAQGQTNE